MDAESKKALRVPFIITLVAAVALLVGFFLPYVSAQGDFREMLLEDPETELGNDTSMTTGEMADASLFEFSRVFIDDMQNVEGYTQVDRTFTLAVFIADGVLSVILLLFAIAKKPVPIIVFSLFGALSFWLTWLDFDTRGLLEERYALGISFYLTIACLVVLFVGAIWLLVEKMKHKKRIKAAE